MRQNVNLLNVPYVFLINAWQVKKNILKNLSGNFFLCLRSCNIVKFCACISKTCRGLKTFTRAEAKITKIWYTCRKWVFSISGTGSIIEIGQYLRLDQISPGKETLELEFQILKTIFEIRGYNQVNMQSFLINGLRLFFGANLTNREDFWFKIELNFWFPLKFSNEKFWTNFTLRKGFGGWEFQKLNAVFKIYG